MSSTDNDQLDVLLKKAGKGPVLPHELEYLVAEFLESNPKAYLILSAYCQGVRQAKPEDGTDALVTVFTPLVLPHLEETNDKDIMIAVTFITALFQVDWQAAAAILQREGVFEMVMDSVELKPSEALSLAVAHLLGQAAGYKPCRALFAPETPKWLEAMSRPSRPENVRAAAAVALVKLSKGSAADAAELTGTTGTAPPPSIPSTDDELTSSMKALVLSSGSHDAVEGLAYLSVNPQIKEILCDDTEFLKALFALVPRRKTAEPISSSLLYGIILIISNLSQYLPLLTEEQLQMKKLRQMAAEKSNGGQSSTDDVLNDDAHVRARCKKLAAAGALEVFPAALAASDSAGVRLEIGRALLGIVTDQANRGRALSSGCAKVLQKITKSALITSDKKVTLDTTHIDAIQALAKLAITASPVQVFGPDTGAIFDIVRPFALALQDSSTRLLTRFEIMMALTNLSSASAAVASRIADAGGLLSRIELFLLEDHTMIRRAAMELVCNLIAGSDKVYERYGGSATEDMGVKGKIQVVLALSDVEDIPTRLAASGALATLSAAPAAARALHALQQDKHRVLPILVQLIDPTAAPDDDGDEGQKSDPGLVHRGVICAMNLLLSTTAKDKADMVKEAEVSGLIMALASVVKSGQVQVAQPAAEALKWILQK